MADGGIQRSTFIIKHDGSIDFSINQKIFVQEPSKVSVVSRQEKLYFPDRGSNPGLQVASLTRLLNLLRK